MKTRIILTAAIVALLMAALPGLVAAGDQRSAPMQTLPGFVEVDGSQVSVNATGDRARVTVKTSGLEGHYAYTLWSFSFSKPWNCSGGACGFDDTETAAQRAAVGYMVQFVAGHPVGGNGKVNFGGTITVPNAAGAEYHIVIADHGVKDPAQLPEQIKTPSPDGVQIGIILP